MGGAGRQRLAHAHTSNVGIERDCNLQNEPGVSSRAGPYDCSGGESAAALSHETAGGSGFFKSVDELTLRRRREFGEKIIPQPG